MSDVLGAAIPLVDLKAAYDRQRVALDEAVARVLASGWYVLGRELSQFEDAFAAYQGQSYAVGVASGTDALLLALRAAGVGPGDEVITVAHTAVATVAAIELAGARPVFVDIDPLTYTLDPTGLPGALTPQTRAIIPVHLYGQTADMDPILAFAHEHRLLIIEDCAQAHGARYQGRLAGTMGDLAAFSFYPTKNLGALGDGGAVTTDRPDLAERLRLLRQYGWRERYVSDIPGFNSRLDELQAAVLRVRLPLLDDDNTARRRLAAVYAKRLIEMPVRLPVVRPGNEAVFHLYVIQLTNRETLQQHLAAQGIGTGIHYPVPVHLQPAYAHLGYRPGSLPQTESVARQILSLPMYPDLPDVLVEQVASTITTALFGGLRNQRPGRSGRDRPAG
jgi:dTDP-4-amino-4,6-dideoxygalactose transaminase